MIYIVKGVGVVFVIIGVLVSILCGFMALGALMITIKKEPNAKTAWIISGVLFGVAVILFNLGGTSPEEENVIAIEPVIQQVAGIDQADPASAVESSPPEALEDYIPWLIHQVTGKLNNRENDRVINVDNDGQSIFVILMADDNVTDNFIRIGITSSSTKIFKRVFTERNDVPALYLAWSMPVRDARGNDSIQPVAIVSMSKENAAKFNWDNFIHTDLPKVADSYIEPGGYLK